MSTDRYLEARRQAHLRRLQDKALRSLRNVGAVSATSGVTRVLKDPSSGLAIIQNLGSEIARTAVSEGPR